MEGRLGGKAGALRQSGQAGAFVCWTDMLSALKTAAEKLSELLLKAKASLHGT